MENESIDELVEIDRKDCVSNMYKSLKLYHTEQQKLINEKSRILSFLNDAMMYEALGFKVKYYYNDKSKAYTFSYEEKEEVGFRK